MPGVGGSRGLEVLVAASPVPRADTALSKAGGLWGWLMGVLCMFLARSCQCCKPGALAEALGRRG